MKLIRLTFTLVLFLFVSMSVNAGTTGHFFKVTAKTNGTGRGLVYGRADTEHGPWLFKESVSSRVYNAGKNATNKTTNVYLYAKPYEGYALENWTDSAGHVVTPGNNFTFIAPSTDITKPTPNIFTANFVDTYVSVFSANNDLCAVSIDKPKNHAGDKVKMTATLKTGVTFLGWRIKGSSTILSTQQSDYEVTANSTKTTYEAAFRYTGTQQIFVKMQSGSNSNKYMSIVQDNFNYTEVMTAGGGYSHITDAEYQAKALEKAGDYLSTDLSLSESIYDPGQIIFHDETNQNFYAQGTDVGYITAGYACHNAGSGTAGIDGVKLKINAQQTKIDSYSRLMMNPSVTYSGANYELGKIFIINEGDNISVSQTQGTSNEYKWNKVEIDGTSQYFSFNPEIRDSKTGKYYTTLRTSFSYKIKNPDKVTAYEINEVADSGTAIMTPFGPDEVIPGDLSVVLESTSQEPTDNILLPWNLDYTKSNSVLFNKYGHRLHCYTGASNSGDQYDNCTEGGIGYFKVNYNSTNMGNMYKLSVNANGEVGFWTKVTSGTVSGNEGYSTVPCGLFKYAELNELPEVADQYTYHITDPLTVAYVDGTNKVIYAKDDNGADEQAPASGEEDFMALHYGENTYVDHSNWVAIEANSLPDLSPRDSRIEATGKVLESAPNRRMVATRVDEVDEEGFFDYNTYSIVNLMPKSSHSTAHHNFFFAAPQANEIANIIWAQWDGNDTFIVPPHSGFTGGIKVDFSMYEGELPVLQNGHEYSFRGLIEKLDPSANAIASKDVETISSLYKVYPLNNLVDMGDIATGVTNNVATSKVVSVKYYNVMGVASDEPFDGVNIVVTTYDNGASTRSKILK